nr:hypothetical protein [bacterium]
VNPEDRSYVAIRIPLAAGMEPMNPALSTAPPEAQPDGENTLSPDYMELRDDYAAYYYNRLPRGTYHIYFRTRASFTGRFTQPPASAGMMYDTAVTGATPGVYVEIEPSH